jgi:hypothetical protein
MRTTTDKYDNKDSQMGTDDMQEKTGLRKRPQASNRFLHSNNFQRYFEENSEDQPKFGWLALEWSRQHGYTQPSKKMIINGILTEVKNHCLEKKTEGEDTKEDEKLAQERMEQKLHTWNLFFSLTELSKGDLDSEIQSGMIGTRAFDPLTSIILYIYSMETFLPALIDNASWSRDESRIDTLGPFVLALHEIVYRANNKRHDVMRGQFSVFRGM